MCCNTCFHSISLIAKPQKFSLKRYEFSKFIHFKYSAILKLFPFGGVASRDVDVGQEVSDCIGLHVNNNLYKLSCELLLKNPL